MGFGDVITSPQTVSTNAAVTVNGIIFGDDNASSLQQSYTVDGTGSVTLANGANTPAITVLEGSHQFQTLSVNLANSADIAVAAASSLAFNNVLNLNGNMLTKTGAGTMSINNTVNTGGGSVVVAGGVLDGNGTVNGDLTNSGGAVAPGNSPGTLSITGDYLQTAGSLLMEIDGQAADTQHDVLDVSGTLTINGGRLDLVTGFTPAVGNTFDILNFASSSGAFDTITGTPAVDMAWDTSQLFVDGTISVISSVVFAWSVDSSGDWAAPSNWGSVITPDGNNNTVLFGSASTAPHTVFTDTAVTARDIQFDNANTYAIGGTGSVNLAADAGNASIDVVQGNHQFQAIVNLNSNTDVNVAASSSLTFVNALNLGSNILTKTGAGDMFINNILSTGGGSLQATAGVLGGSGTIGGDLANIGATVAPGNSAGTLTVDGNYTQTLGSLTIEIGGLLETQEYDVLNVLGSITLGGGTLDVVLINGFAPSEGDSFDILDFNSLTGSFSSVNLPAGYDWNESLLLSDGILSVVLPVYVPGDADKNGVVDGTDAAILAANWLAWGGWNEGDFNADEIIDDKDATLMAANWGAGLAGTNASVPEPGSLVLLVAGGLFLGAAGWRRRFRILQEELSV